jgi:hypothetical protein
MLGVTLFGLFLTPVFYTVIAGLRDRATTRRVHHHAPIANAAPAEGH